jgi:hypothetical protein
LGHKKIKEEFLMTNTKFRKKALLSSVAMLLVALVALGSATFAWFVANPTVTASGLKMQTNAAAGIYVASESAINVLGTSNRADAFGKTTLLDAQSGTEIADLAGRTAEQYQKFVLLPTSLDNTATSPAVPDAINAWAHATAAQNTAPGKNDSAYVAGVDGSTFTYTATTSAGGTGVYYEDIYVKTTTSTETDSVEIRSAYVKITLPTNAGSGDICQGIRVALTVPVAASGSDPATERIIGIWAPSGHTAGYCWDKSSASAARKSTTYLDGTTDALGAKASIDSGVLTATPSTEANKIRVYVYLDGEDANVFSSNISTLTEVLAGISVQLSSNP